MSADLQQILKDRKEKYGDFTKQSMASQDFKDVIKWNMCGKENLFDFDQKEALDMICHKLARIVNGSPNHVDSWLDIAGYALLVAERLNEKESRSMI